MRILILDNNTRCNSYADFLFQLLLQSLTENNFLIIKTNKFSEANKVNFQENNAVVFIDASKTRSSLFFSYRLQSLIKKLQIKWLVQITDNKIISSRLPQLIISNNVGKFISSKTLSSSLFAVCSQLAKQKIIDKHNLIAGNIQAFPAAASPLFQPVSWSEQQSVRMQYTQGREYFYATADGKTFDSLTSLLKAFTSFKKWQHSSMKLVISGELYFTRTKEWIEKINTYKYRDDVVLTSEEKDRECIHLLSGAYVFLHLPTHDNDVVPVLQAMQCETPCISFITDSISEYADAAVVLIEQNNYEQLGEKMILLYKDEILRSELIEKGKQRAKQYTAEKAFSHLMRAMPSDIH